MRKWITYLGFLVAVLSITSCKARVSDLQPPPEPPAYRLPPNDPRYAQPIQYPSGTLHEDPFATKKGGMMGGPGSMRQMGMPGPGGF